MRCAPRTVERERERLSLVKQHSGDVRLSALTREAIAGYQQARHDAGIANRTVTWTLGPCVGSCSSVAAGERYKIMSVTSPNGPVPSGEP